MKAQGDLEWTQTLLQWSTLRWGKAHAYCLLMSTSMKSLLNAGCDSWGSEKEVGGGEKTTRRLMRWIWRDAICFIYCRVERCYGKSVARYDNALQDRAGTKYWITSALLELSKKTRGEEIRQDSGENADYWRAGQGRVGQGRAGHLKRQHSAAIILRLPTPDHMYGHTYKLW